MGFIGKHVRLCSFVFVDQTNHSMDEALGRPPWISHGQGDAGLRCAVCDGLRHGLSPWGHREATQSWCEVTCSSIGWERVVRSPASRISDRGSMELFVDVDCPCRRMGGGGRRFVVLRLVICIHFILHGWCGCRWRRFNAPLSLRFPDAVEE
jgi:hypothetical protein